MITCKVPLFSMKLSTLGAGTKRHTLGVCWKTSHFISSKSDTNEKVESDDDAEKKTCREANEKETTKDTRRKRNLFFLR